MSHAHAWRYAASGFALEQTVTNGVSRQQYFVDDRLPRITGLAWIGSSSKQEEWAFELVLVSGPNLRRDIVHFPDYETPSSDT